MKTVHICLARSSGHVILDREGSTRDTHCAVEGVPEDIPAAEVVLRVSRLAFQPWPKTLRWPDIAELPSGSLVRTGRVEPETYIGDGVYVSADFGGGIKLRAPREDGDHVVYLEPQMITDLLKFVRKVWPDWKPPL